jgi:predicted DNA-binding protein (UPF0251 family)
MATERSHKKKVLRPAVRGRPKKPRVIRDEPVTRQFSPRGRVGRPGHMELKMEEFEALRLADHIGMGQREASEFMKISQQTFSRVLKAARKNVAEALVKGEIIKVRGGAFKLEKNA